MVDVQAVNQKLVRRSEEMLLKLTARSLEDVRQALQQANGNVKLAVLLLRGCDTQKAQALLDLAHGELRAALHLLDLRGSGRGLIAFGIFRFDPLRTFTPKAFGGLGYQH